MDFKTSKTYENLQNAFKGESQASTKYKIFSEIADEEEYLPIARVFTETSGNEAEHAHLWYKLLHDGRDTTTEDNLKDAMAGEQNEWMHMYEDYAATAEAEGFQQIADLFRKVALIEHHHDHRFRQLLKELQEGKVYCSDNQIIWICMNCGYLYYGTCAPDKCPVCGYPKEYFARLRDNDYDN